MRGHKLTKRTVDALKPTSRDTFAWDSELPGFGCKITPAGTRVYVFQYTKGKRKRRVTIGRHGAPWTPETARKEALTLRGDVAKGGDPAEVHARDRRAPTLTEFAERYLRDHAETKKKPRSVQEDRRLLENQIKPKLGHWKLRDIMRTDVIRLHLGLRETPIQANRALALLSKMMNLAERWGLRPDNSNPCRLVEKFKERRIERFLSAAELKRLGDALTKVEQDGSEPAAAVAAIRLLVLTGCRLSEILTLQWKYVDLDNLYLRLPDSKTGAKAVPLGAPAVQLIDGLPRVEGNPFVFAGRLGGKHLVGLSHVWTRLREAAKLPDVRLHDLRHSFASVGAIGGASLLVLGAILGHRQAATTQRYAHLSNDPVRAAADRIARSIDAAMKGSAGEVVEFVREGAR